MPGNPGGPVVTTPACFFFCPAGCGCIGRPAFPTPSWGESEGTTRTHRAAGMRRYIQNLLGCLKTQECAAFYSPLVGEVGSHRQCDPGEGLRSIDRPEPLTPTLSHKGRGSALSPLKHCASSLRTQGPIITGRGVTRKSSNSGDQTKGRGVWVPAFAGTTMMLEKLSPDRRTALLFAVAQAGH